MNREERRKFKKLLARKPQNPNAPIAGAWWSLREEDQTALQLIPHSALDNFRRGAVQDGDFDTLAMRVNWCKVTALDARLGDDVMAVAEAGVQAMLSVQERYDRLGRWGMTGPEMTAVGACLNLMDDMQVSSRRVDVLRTMRKVFAVAAK